MNLKDIAQLVTDKISSRQVTLQDYVTTDSLLPNKQGRTIAQNLPPQPCTLTRFQVGDVLVANIRPYLQKVWLADCEGAASTDVLVFRSINGHSSQYLYAVLLQDSFYEWVMLGTKGSRMPRGNKDNIIRFHQFNSRLWRKFQPKKPNPSSTAVQNASRLFWIST